MKTETLALVVWSPYQPPFEICEECGGSGEVEKNFPATETTLEFDAPVECWYCEGKRIIINSL